MEAQLLKYYCSKRGFKSCLLNRKIEFILFLVPNVDAIRPCIPLTNSENLDRSVKHNLYGFKDEEKIESYYGKEYIKMGIYRINVKPTGKEITMKEFIEQLTDERDIIKFNIGYEADKDVQGSMYYAFNEISTDQWVSVEYYDGESWTEVDFNSTISNISVEE
jgi:hypothetical protein